MDGALFTNKRLRKSPTSSVVDGPPMLRNTIAVGPFELAAFCVTGGAGVANDLVCGGAFVFGIQIDWRAGDADPGVTALAALSESCAKE